MSNWLSLNVNDALKGLLVAVISAILTGVYAIISTGVTPTPDQWKAIALAGATAGVAYLIKNFFTNSQGQIKPEVK